MSDAPLFSSSREALTFAANFKAASVQAPVMNRMLLEMQKVDKEAQAISRRQKVPALQGLTSLDKAAQAGMILQLAGRLPDESIHVMLAAVLKPRDVCSCRQPCCQGWRSNRDWVESLAVVDGLVWKMLDDAKQAGKKGSFTLTAALRVELVRQYFDRERQQPKAHLAERFEISEATVAAHQKKLGGHLTGLVRSAFTKLDEVLVDAGIVGATE